ncbi:MAG: DAK2 domain-containing protein [Actinobacteria bacterium]|uniref:Unannotated protein n=1 Tax=freshwater metagenome TaxID=449393 RepID=A0A6J6NXP7_9ZZZZ|nr:DAK2 domain-containing protein [Actinomycetota bacterium]
MRGRVLDLARGGLVSIEAQRGRIDDLNVFPVPDGDTGTNLTLTVRAIVEALEAPGADDRAGLAHEVARAALMGARGNSGVILSQIVRGAAEALGGTESLDLAAVLRGASDAAYRAVKSPVEGTMLTAVRELAEAAEAGGEIAAVIARGDDCVRRTPELLPVLADAGVVDAGAAGFLEIVRGVASVWTGEVLVAAAAPAAPRLTMAADLAHDDSEFQYCTVFVVEGEGLDADSLEHELARLGDSLLVVGDSAALKVHVHTDDPGAALSLGVARGTLAGIEIANMHAQTRDRERRLQAVPDLPVATCGLVVVSAGAGNRALFESLGAIVVDGGETMNPSTAEILSAVELSPTTEVVVLPNNKNVVMAAEHAAANAQRVVRVVPTVSMQAGLAAAVAFDASAEADANVTEMAEVVEGVRTGAVARASRDAEFGGVDVRAGEWLALQDGNAVATDPEPVGAVRALVERLLSEPRAILTVLLGEEAPDLSDLLAEVATRFPDLELDVHEGGQPHYAVLLSAE